MSQTKILQDLLNKFIENIGDEFDISSEEILYKWGNISENSSEFNKPVENVNTYNQDSSFFSNKRSKTENNLKKQSSISTNFPLEIEKEILNSKSEHSFPKKSPIETDFHNKNHIDLSENSFLGENESKNKYYVLTKTVQFLEKNMRFVNLEDLNLSSYFLSTYLLEIGNCDEPLLKSIAISYFLNLLMESYNDENSLASQLYDVYSLVNLRQIVLKPQTGSIFTEEQLSNAFKANITKILILKSKSNLSFNKLSKCFSYLIWQKPLFLESMVVLVKELMLAKVSNNNIEKESMHKLIFQICDEPKHDLLKLITETLNRNIDLYEINGDVIDLTTFKCNQKIPQNNKITLLSCAKRDKFIHSLVLNVSEKDCFEKLEILTKEEIAFLEDMSTTTIMFSKQQPLGITNVLLYYYFFFK